MNDEHIKNILFKIKIKIIKIIFSSIFIFTISKKSDLV